MELKNKLLEAFSEFLEKAVGSTTQEQKSETLDEEMVSYEVIYEPFTKDAHGEWMSDKTIEKAMENFNKNLEKGIVQPNLFHLKDTHHMEVAGFAGGNIFTGHADPGSQAHHFAVFDCGAGLVVQHLAFLPVFCGHGLLPPVK